MADVDPDDSSYLKSPEASKAHDELVRVLINRTIDELSVHSQSSDDPALARKKSIAVVLEQCNAAMTNKRYEDVRNTVVRDAESYFITRSRVGSHSWDIGKRYSSLLWTEAPIWYDRGKTVTNPLNRVMPSHFLQSQDRNPNSEPGGARWALRGVADGKLDDPNSEARPRHCVLTPYYDETTP